ncbi:ATP-dependent DNA helicase RecG [Dellaglioa algida]|uniref:ATP-dependent DNA helicase RecG n=1 Tax=Dellaglioa algida DSM 15638 TaxID=1423719 RepID=A0A0R1HJG7_9LACO|nr:ATP-dependent DNA helicase RecG [Dellaglioa algida]KRK46512.1 ATP-dependent DNA helicase RecG [Dellaglioa algida DSM 15638]MDK1732571.1 ATP-dependent DNA helicase RecG [Dellaglioa algida]MDK1734041.1 ATP-dependent DNA helicase RecG [Dellaglioa algida]
MASLDDSVGVLTGVGPKKLTALNQLGINTIEDLLTFYPYRYDDLKAKKLSEITDQEKVTLKGTVSSEPVLVRFGQKRNLLNVRLLVDDGNITVSFFNQPFLQKQFEIGKEVAVYGKWDDKRKSLSGMKLLTKQTDDGLAAIYRSSKDIHQTAIRQLITQAFEQYADEVGSLLPTELIQKYRLVNRKMMLHDIHFPKDEKNFHEAKRTAIFEEFFLFQLKLQYVKKTDTKNYGIKINYQNNELKKFIQTLPFELTAAQKKVVNEICADMKQAIHMNRLLQGDVGSGKTIVAAIVMYAAITAGYQAVLMAPTEILAEQHANNMATLFADFPVNVALLTGSMKVKARRELLAHLESGEVNLIVGTHAIIQPDVSFKRVGLVITDEQHRFGVNQRRILREKGAEPDVLAMTATPIPRTLAITAYGEMDVSTINELPAGRQPITTSWLKSSQVGKGIDLIKEQLAQGSQAYIITPLIDESETLDLKNALALYENMKEIFEPKYKVGLLHGKMKNDEKDQMMADFKANKYQALVSTTVIEVGVDVPNATVMMIYNAERFGLAQLHQLRGRVGRGKKASYCVLIADPKNEFGIQRMQIMTETTDGFVISQKDLELRGAGDVLGRKQSGIPEFKIGDPIGDINALQVAQQEAHEIVFRDDFENNPEFKPLNDYLKEHQNTDLKFD